MRRLWLAVMWLLGCGRFGFDGPNPSDGPNRSDGPTAIDGSGGLGDPALIGYYAFDDDPSDGVDNRAPGYPIAICAVSCPTLIPGVLGGAFEFAGGSVISIADRPHLHLAAGTIALWVRVDELPVGGGDVSIFGKAHGPGVLNTYELYLARTQASVVVRGGGDATINAYAEAAWPHLPGTWVHLALTWDATARLYDGGVEIAQAPRFDGVYDDHPLTVGADINAEVFSGYLRGAVDEVWIFSRELTADEVVRLATP